MNEDNAQWLEAINALFADVEQWCSAQGWVTTRQEKRLTESKLGDYTTAVLIVHGPGVTLYLEPVARYVASGDGLIDLYAWPSMQAMRLVRVGDVWLLKTESGVVWPNPWSMQTFVNVVRDLNAAA